MNHIFLHKKFYSSLIFTTSVLLTGCFLSEKEENVEDSDVEAKDVEDSNIEETSDDEDSDIEDSDIEDLDIEETSDDEENDHCCEMTGPSCDCFQIGGSRPFCESICDAAPVGWVLEEDENGCPILRATNGLSCHQTDVDVGVDSDVSEDIDSGIDPESRAIGESVLIFPADPVENVRIRYDGPLSSLSNLGIHYGFNGWNEVGDTDWTSHEDGTSNTDYFAEREMLFDEEGAYIDFDLSAEVRAMHFVFFAGDTDDLEWDNNNELDYQFGIQYALIGPFLTWNEEISPENGIVVNFITGDQCKGSVILGSDPADLALYAEETAETTDHHIVLDDLESNTTYYYQAWCDRRRMGPISQFTTIDPASAELRFAVIGDAQSKGEETRWPDVANALFNDHFDIHFVLVVGDLAWNDRPGLWWSYFDKGRELFATHTQIAVIGNHDTPTTGRHENWSSFERYFALEDNTWRTQVVGPAHFTLFNSEDPSMFEKNVGEQYLWAETEISAIPADIPWRFVAQHIGPYDTGNRHNAEQGDYRDITTFFDDQIDWMFFGHEHLYQRFHPMRFNAQIIEDGQFGRGDGVGYMLVPPAGAWPGRHIISVDDGDSHRRNRLAFPEINGDENTVDSENGFVIVSINEDLFHLTTFGVGNHSEYLDPHIVDQIEYTRSESE